MSTRSMKTDRSVCFFPQPYPVAPPRVTRESRSRKPVSDLLVPFVYRLAGREIRMCTTIATIGDAHDVTLNELRIETFFPMDDESRTGWLRFVSREPVGE